MLVGFAGAARRFGGGWCESGRSSAACGRIEAAAVGLHFLALVFGRVFVFMRSARVVATMGIGSFEVALSIRPNWYLEVPVSKPMIKIALVAA